MKTLKIILLSLALALTVSAASGPSIDPQALGWHDDGTEQGVLRTTSVRGDLACYPLAPNVLSVSFGGNGSTYLNLYYAFNGDKASRGGVVAGYVDVGTTNYAQFIFTFQGRALGISFGNSIANVANVAFLIDGVAYAVTNKTPGDMFSGATSGWATRCMVADDLSDGLHECVVRINGRADLAQLFSFGSFFADAGFRSPSVQDGIWTCGVYTFNSAVTNGIASCCNNSGHSLLQLSEVEFANNSTVSNATVCVTMLGTVVWQCLLPPGTSGCYSRSIPISVDGGTYKIGCTATNVVAAIYGTTY